MKKPATQLSILLILVLVPLEIVCAYLAYETIGEITSMLYYMAVGLNLLFLLVAIRYPRAAAAGALILALAIVPYQLVLGDRLLRVQEEAARIVTYAYDQRLATGEFPSNLLFYDYDDPAMTKYVQHYTTDASAGGFYLAFRVGTETTSHTYTPNAGWGYYPD